MTQLSLAEARKNPFYTKVTSLLQEAFPGARADAAMVALMLEGLKASEADFVRSLEEWLHSEPLSVDNIHDTEKAIADLFGKHTCYELEAMHLRQTPVYSCFTGVLQAVRVSLHDASRLPFITTYGTVWNHDHLLFTVEDVRSYIAGIDPNFMEFERVDLITPAREMLVRFAPVALFLGYAKADDPEPSFYILESGYATGEPAVLYFGPTMDFVITQQTGYVPTPWSKVDNWYTTNLTMQDGGDEPRTVVIESREELGQRPYITITLDYRVLDEPGDTLFPGKQTMEAALRLATIAEGMGCELGPLQTWLAGYGLRTFEWNLTPDGMGRVPDAP